MWHLYSGRFIASASKHLIEYKEWDSYKNICYHNIAKHYYYYINNETLENILITT